MPDIQVQCGKFDLNSVSMDDVISTQSKTWIKADVEEKIIFYDGGDGIRPHVVIKLGGPIGVGFCEDTKELNRSLAMLLLLFMVMIPLALLGAEEEDLHQFLLINQYQQVLQQLYARPDQR